MFDARKFNPHPSAIAAGTVARAGGGLVSPWHPRMALPTVSFPIRRGVMR
jgi:hypothetical protein